jgi:uncharacterized membrane protein
MRWLFRRRLCFGGLVGALVFFCWSLAPSLLPRGVVLQGLISGITAAIGYGFGSAASAIVRKIQAREPRPRTKHIGWSVLLLATIVLVPLVLFLGGLFQNDLRDLMGMGSLASWDWGLILVLTVVTGSIVLFIARLVRGLGRVLMRVIDRFLPRRISVAVGVTLTAAIVIGMIQGFLLHPALDALNSAYGVVNEGTTEGVSQPTQFERSGSPASLVPWDTLGVQGRDFTGIGTMIGPTRAQLTEFNGSPAKEPIRVYVGLESAGSVEARVELALKELDRTDAWSRQAIGIFTTTGTGWVDERAASPVEYMYNGDSALIGLQYSYLPSWISFLVDVEKAADAGREMIQAVQERLATMPASSRPKLLLFGESLGSFGTEEAFADIDQMVANVDGALLVGPVFRNHIHNDVTDHRDGGSPSWRPVYENGAHVRAAVAPADVEQLPAEWNPPRIMYLQNSSDPITYWNFELIWNRPEWLDKPRGPDVSDRMFWAPVVTFWGTLGDMVFSTGVPAGHGHDYGANPVDAWAHIIDPPGWTAEKTAELREIVKNK